MRAAGLVRVEPEAMQSEAEHIAGVWGPPQYYTPGGHRIQAAVTFEAVAAGADFSRGLPFLSGWGEAG